MRGKVRKPKWLEFTLRNQLLLTIMPAVLVPLVVASTVGYKVMQQNSEARIVRQLHDRVLLANETTSDLLTEAFKFPKVIADNPIVINAARDGKQQAEKAGLPQLPIAELDKRFVSKKNVLEHNRSLNKYLKRTAQNFDFAELSFTQKHGFNIAYSHRPSDFVQRDEEWWQKGKNEERWLGSVKFHWSAKTFGIELVQAIKDPESGEFLGVVKCLFPVEQFKLLIKYLEHTGITGSQTVQLVDTTSGDLLYSIDVEGGTTEANIIRPEVVLAVGEVMVNILKTPELNFEEEISDVQTKYLLEKLAVEDFTNETGDSSVVVSFIHQDSQLQYFTMTTIPGTSWVAIASMPMAEIAAAAKDLVWVFAAVAVFLGVVAISIILLLARQLSAPLGNLASRASEVADGNLNIFVEPRGTSETRTLARSFNDLIKQVKHLLEKQTAEAELQRQQKELQLQQKEALQRQVSQLLREVEGVSVGDLTVRAHIKQGEIGIIADFFNSIIENLRDLVTQVKQSAIQVNGLVGENEGDIRQLAKQAKQQVNQITEILKSVEQMSCSIQEVADNASAAAEVAHLASNTALKGGENIDLTVETILRLRATVAETAKKVKRLGESSQEISKVISLINQIALQTNLLAINASIEAARAGEEGRGFAVVAEEVGELSAQAAGAAKEIEEIVENIQSETSRVVAAMELGTSEVVEGTRMVEKTKQSLEEIVDVSTQIDILLQSISTATVSQAQTSQSITLLMEEIAKVSEHTSDSSSHVSTSLQQTVEIAQQLQGSVGTFKVSSSGNKSG